MIANTKKFHAGVKASIAATDNSHRHHVVCDGVLYRVVSLPTDAVIHVRDIEHHADAVYIGREHSGRGHGPSFKRSPWANPWTVKAVGHQTAIVLYAKWIAGDLEAAALLPPGRWHRPSVEEIRAHLCG